MSDVRVTVLVPQEISTLGAEIYGVIEACKELLNLDRQLLERRAETSENNGFEPIG